MSGQHNFTPTVWAGLSQEAATRQMSMWMLLSLIHWQEAQARAHREAADRQTRAEYAARKRNR
jgi:hypothetical protein